MNLLLTLGHNSSAIAIDKEGNIICGYEEERLTRKKSDSSYPKNAIEEVFHHIDIDKENKIFISHWFDNFTFYPKVPKDIVKYFDFDHLVNIFYKERYSVYTLSSTFTHHDSHAWSAKAFYDFHKKENNKPSTHIVVADGFGNKQEVLSIYELKSDQSINLSRRVYGYKNSLGLLYQYATSFCGMKENQDEYKFLGYESKISDVLLYNQRLSLTRDSYGTAEYLYHRGSTDNTEPYLNGNYIDIEELNRTKNNLYNNFKKIVDEYSPYFREKENSDNIKILIGFYIQNIIEFYMLRLISEFNIENIILTGGLFYNVKLNNRVMENIKSVTVMPLAGDQGAALGLYYKNIGDPIDFSTLCWGKRDLNIYENNNIGGLITFENENSLIDMAKTKLLKDEIVQVVTGDMEFGPRALCNTSTLALPNKKNIDIINQLNNRNTVMPMAPVMTELGYEYLFNKSHRERVIGSEQFMIITLNYKDYIVYEEFFKYEGVMHNYPAPRSNEFSGRPQVVKDKNSYIYKLLKEVEKEGYMCLINTSFNVHGKPIIFNQVIEDFTYQLQMKEKFSIDKNIWTFIL